MSTLSFFVLLLSSAAHAAGPNLGEPLAPLPRASSHSATTLSPKTSSSRHRGDHKQQQDAGFGQQAKQCVRPGLTAVFDKAEDTDCAGGHEADQQ